MSGPASSSITAVVVYFRTPERLSACLESLRAQTLVPTEVVVVDNSSAIDGVSERPAGGRDWRWVRSRDNLGFGAACNVGARGAESDYLLFLNADLTLAPEACRSLCAAAERSVGTVAVGPRVYAADGSIELSARSFPTIATGLLGRSSLLSRALSRVKRTPLGVSAALGPERAVDWISGACMLISRVAFQEVYGFDEGYWMYWEDADICRRLKDRGLQIMFCPDAQARHSTGSSGQNRSTIEAFHMSAARYYERHLAFNAAAARLARSLLRVRMNLMLYRHAHRTGSSS